MDWEARRAKDEPDVVLEAEVRRRPADAQGNALPRSVQELADYHTVVLGDASPRLDRRRVRLRPGRGGPRAGARARGRRRPEVHAPGSG